MRGSLSAERVRRVLNDTEGPDISLQTHRLTEEESRAAAADIAAVPRQSLVVVHAAGTHLFPLAEGRAAVLGREGPVDIVVEDRGLSRRHAAFEVENGELWVTDLGSTNGTKINGQFVSERSRIRPGDEVGMGSVLAYLHVPARLGPLSKMISLDHDRFRALVEDEIDRARFFASRTTALVFIKHPRLGRGADEPLIARCQDRFRPFDRVARYSEGEIEVLLPEIDRETALAWGHEILRMTRVDGAKALMGVALFPELATSAEELFLAAKEAAQSATEDDPIRVAPSLSPRMISSRPEKGRGAEGDAVYKSESMREVFEAARRIARSTIPVLIRGETGSGKELVARAIHEHGPRGRNPLIAVNCAAIHSTLLESSLFGHE